MEEVKCCNCGNIVSYDYDELDKFLKDSNKCLATNNKTSISILVYIDNVVNCCFNPDYVHV